MALDLADYELRATAAVQAFWNSRETARQRQQAAGLLDAGERAGVTAGRNMDGFCGLIVALAHANGLDAACIHRARRLLTLPGYFRPTKQWDLLIVDPCDGALIAAIELKSQVGPSFGNNFNNRTEEAIGTAHDFWTAYREGALGATLRPFTGWLMLVEDAPGSRRPVRDASPHFPVLPEFAAASYLRRYELLCERLVREQLYTAAAVIASPRSAAGDGQWTELSPSTGLRTFVSALAGHMAAVAAQRS